MWPALKPLDGPSVHLRMCYYILSGGRTCSKTGGRESPRRYPVVLKARFGERGCGTQCRQGHFIAHPIIWF